MKINPSTAQKGHALPGPAKAEPGKRAQKEQLYFSQVRSNLQIAAGSGLGAIGSIELVVVAGQHSVQQDAGDRGHSQTGQVDGDAWARA